MNCRSGSFFFLRSGRNFRHRFPRRLRVFRTSTLYRVQILRIAGFTTEYLAECVFPSYKLEITRQGRVSGWDIFRKEARLSARGQVTTTWPASNHRLLVGMKVLTFCGDGSFPRRLILPDPIWFLLFWAVDCEENSHDWLSYSQIMRPTTENTVKIYRTAWFSLLTCVIPQIFIPTNSSCVIMYSGLAPLTATWYSLHASIDR